MKFNKQDLVPFEWLLFPFETKTCGFTVENYWPDANFTVWFWAEGEELEDMLEDNGIELGHGKDFDTMEEVLEYCSSLAESVKKFL